MAVKFGVGVALIVAAHFVLVRRWNNGKSQQFYLFIFFSLAHVAQAMTVEIVLVSSFFLQIYLFYYHSQNLCAIPWPVYNSCTIFL